MPPKIETPWARARKLKYQEQEDRTAKKPGATAQLNSGRTWSALRDVTLKTFLGKLLIDNKTTELPSYRLTKPDWHGLKRDANRTPPGCLPALQIDIQDLKLMVLEELTWDELVKYVLRLETNLEDAMELIEKYRERYGDWKDEDGSDTEEN